MNTNLECAKMFCMNSCLFNTMKIKKINNKHLSYSECELIKESERFFKSTKIMKNFITNIYKNGCDTMNGYHNGRHFFEVLQVTDYLLRKIGWDISEDDKHLLKVTALCHDLCHSGINNNKWDNIVNNKIKLKECLLDKVRSRSFITNSIEDDISSDINDKNIEELYEFVRTKSCSSCENSENNTYITEKMTLCYQDDLTRININNCYNESFHIDKTLDFIEMFKKDIFKKHHYTNESVWEHKRRLIKSLILSTCLSSDKKYRNYIKNSNHTKLGKMILILKLADLSHTWFRPFQIHSYWVFKRMNEDNENLDNLKDIARDTINFMEVFVEPLLNIFKDSYGQYLYKYVFYNYEKNKQIWATYL